MNVTLLKPLTHAGIDFAAGDTLDVDEATAQWLAENGVIAAKITPVAQTKKQAGVGARFIAR